MNIINPMAPVSEVADQLARPLRIGCFRLLDVADDEAALIAYLVEALRPSPVRGAPLLRERLSDTQFDANVATEENGGPCPW